MIVPAAGGPRRGEELEGRLRESTGMVQGRCGGYRFWFGTMVTGPPGNRLRRVAHAGVLTPESRAGDCRGSSLCAWRGRGTVRHRGRRAGRRPFAATPVGGSGHGTTLEKIGVVCEHPPAYAGFGVLCFSAKRRISMTVVGGDSEPPPRILSCATRDLDPAGELATVVVEFEGFEQ